MASVPLLNEDDTLAFGEEDTTVPKRRPYITFFHLAFRVAAVFAYLSCKLFTNSYITSFVVIVILLSMDFWTVKNVTGRLMVGLRWWNYVDDNGVSHWVFESRKGSDQNRINDAEAHIFWTALILATFVWCILFIIALFTFKIKWMLLVIIALMLNGANLYGYIMCKVGNVESLSVLTSSFLRQQVLQNAVSLVVGQTKAPQANPMAPPSNTV